MAGSVNKVILIGNLGKDPEIRRLNSGEPVVNLRVATSENWRDKSTGERREKTEWHNVVIFNENIAKVAEQYLKKGSKVYVEGQLQTRKWTDQQGQEKYTTEVVLQRFRGELTMLDGTGEGGGGGPMTRAASMAAARSASPKVRARISPPTWTTKFRSKHVHDRHTHPRAHTKGAPGDKYMRLRDLGATRLGAELLMHAGARVWDSGAPNRRTIVTLAARASTSSARRGTEHPP